MTVRVYPQLIRLALATIQPASAETVVRFVQSALDSQEQLLDLSEVQKLIENWEELADVVCVHKRYQLYSLTKRGANKLSKTERQLRDKTRLFLLKELCVSKLKSPEVQETEKADASSAVVIEPVLQEDKRPISPAVPPRPARSSGRGYWPLLSKQLFVGSSTLTSGPRLRFLSFQSEKSCVLACGTKDSSEFGIGVNEIALSLGISPGLLTSMQHKPEKHYRTFEIPKSNGKPRLITAPRTMMKVVQYFFLDYVLRSLPVHTSATAYQRGCSIRQNALQHLRQRYVANIDVSDFFPSLTTAVVTQKLVEGGLKINTALLVAKLCSYDDGLPQGAPTSAAISNIVLFDFDTAMSEYAGLHGLTYTRYADDISISGSEKSEIEKAISVAQKLLSGIGLKLNDSKTRIFGPSSRKVVTGVVVNEWAQPSRKQRRNLRAALHQASLHPERYVDKYHQLQGKAAYMLSFATPEHSVGGLSSEFVHNAIAEIKKRI
ncbi:MAG: hypothetical protein CMN89_08060 [Sutterellaceae bacterium]|uniref:retron St85 family RNA-directed DNA polymerase n=1 Tax=unclassified Limnobacter TaxID=2630203 RepID=UPI000C588479|nr:MULTISPECIES: retron St85 family RNA-directed DNA polymerase [unclassified Limnobacter]MAG81918.1 hypothetical protein [Sutterellaceae bacterium]MBT84422.1 hypothetical protein [Sutterellaceae bacterium]|tara:strand:- start:12150 stop:13622 length:1473 start_codon:yes stop_codon:yes gene_type:complete